MNMKKKILLLFFILSYYMCFIDFISYFIILNLFDIISNLSPVNVKFLNI